MMSQGWMVVALVGSTMGQETEGIVDHWSWKPSSSVSAAVMIKGLHVEF